MNLPSPTNAKTTLQPVTDLQTVIVKASYEVNITRFKLCLPSTLNKLIEEVGMRLDLEIGSFKLRYRDGDWEKVLLDRDDDLQLCLESLSAQNKNSMNVLVYLIPSEKGSGSSTMFDKKHHSKKQPLVLCRDTRSGSSENIISLMPAEFQPYIIDCKNVEGDGHCGFRVVAALMGFGEDSWSRVRQDLMNELIHHTNLYKGAFKEEDSVEDIFESLNCFTNTAPFKNWFMLPYMGYLVASTYNIAFSTLSAQISLTFLPLRSAVPQRPRSICMGMVKQNHFIQVLLGVGHPMPPIANSWFDNHLKIADEWEGAFNTSHIS